MAFSLLHALLLSDPNDKAEHWSDYQNLDPSRQALLMKVLYDMLYDHIGKNRDLRGGPIGTILARAITQEDPRRLDSDERDLQYYADALRDDLRHNLIEWLNVIMNPDYQISTPAQWA